MHTIIPVINKLQDVFSAIGQVPVDLPQIVCIGSQSSGKTSVLENIVGRDFLPRGSGIVTRRPLVLQLLHVEPSSVDRSQSPPVPLAAGEGGGDPAGASSGGVGKAKAVGEEWAEFLHLPDRKFYEFEEVRNEIVRETERLTGKNKGISNKSITLKIYSPHVLNLTLVDLPGITKVPVGDQPADIEKQVRDMCMHFASNPNSLILAVTAANTDLANSDALKLAREVDPAGMRTIGVITKIDLMDPGTDALDMLEGRVVPLRRGFVGVANRSQADINSAMAIRDALRKERAFFEGHAAYRGIAARLGAGYLSKMLNIMLMDHIRDCLPELKGRISSLVLSLDAELESMGSAPTRQSQTELGKTLLHLISRFAANFKAEIDGRAVAAPGEAAGAGGGGGGGGGAGGGAGQNELYGGARIAYIFNEVFGRRISSIDTFDGLSDDDIRTAIRNANGTRAALFVPEVSFELLVKRQIARLEQPGQQCVDLVFDELLRVTSHCQTLELRRFSPLRNRIVDAVTATLRKLLAPSHAMIASLVQIELAHINTSHPDFIGGSRALAELVEARSTTASLAPQGLATPSPATVLAAAVRSPASLGGPPPPPDANRAPTPNSFLADRECASSTEGVGAFASPGAGAGRPSSRRDHIIKLPPVPATMRADSEPTERERLETAMISM
jgi:dynamin 1-like protein